ncbi:FAD:protein FMN transferase [Nocardioides KLBMP 9356]|uniref:FAD:protein FMN transferase n=1 Tax=Nocardioides potassii TaxID=2911371 RepID=A0ABS9H633_9ACTN|nr:FAD:protein FMN transferase [Nocardioides potassii]MCF6376710.1 FAD:protein FMN transferase [Nocardioides potassii]
MSTAAPAVARRVEHVMGMPVSLALRGRHASGPEADAAWDAALAELRWVDEVFSTWRPDSQVSRLGRGEVTVDECDPAVAEVLRLGDAARASSGGAFDILLPGPDGVRRLEPSGVVKGWAVDRAVRPLLALADTDVCLSVGGDMVCHVADDAGEPWLVGIEHPLDPTRLVAQVPVRRAAVATSGTAHRGAHVVDARTGGPAEAVASVTVIGADLTSVDIDATTALALGLDGPQWLRSRLRTGVVVWADGRAEVVV